MDQNMNQPGVGKTCSCGHHKAMPILIILFGLTFLLGAFGVMSGYVVSIVWPILVIIAGIVKLMKRMCKCC